MIECTELLDDYLAATQVVKQARTALNEAFNMLAVQNNTV